MGFATYDEVKLQGYKQQTGPVSVIGDAVTDVALLKGRISTGTKAGTALVLDSSYLYSEGLELRYKVTDWTNIGSGFSSLYLRAEAGVASGSQGIKALECYSMANATFSVANLDCAYFEIGMKASGTQTITAGKAVEASIAPYTGTGAITITNYLDCILLTPSGVTSRLSAPNAAKINGIHMLARDGDGGSTVLGYGIWFENDSGQAGTRTLTTGFYLNIGCATGILIAGATTTGINITGSAADALKVSTGTFTNGLNVSGTLTTGVLIGAATTGMLISGATTTGISITGNATDAIKILTGTYTTAINIAGTTTTAIKIGTCTTGIDLNGATITTEIKLKNANTIANPAAGYVSLPDSALRIFGVGGTGAASSLQFEYSVTANASATATMTNSPKSGNPAMWVNCWYGATGYCFPIWLRA